MESNANPPVPLTNVANQPQGEAAAQPLPAEEKNSVISPFSFFKSPEGDYCVLDAVTQAGLCEIMGRRPSQEDQLRVVPMDFFSELSSEEQDDVLTKTFAIMQEKYGREEFCRDKETEEEEGSCICVATAWPDTNNHVHTKTANLGDSTAFLIVIDKEGIVKKQEQLNQLHNPTVKSEYDRVKKPNEKRKRYVCDGRVYGVLAVSRAIGDPAILDDLSDHIPEISSLKYELAEGDQAFLVVACDGLTEKKCLNIDDISTIVKQNQNSTKDAADRLVKAAYKGGSKDNISVAVIQIKNPVSAAVFDGHNGSKVSKALAENFYPELLNQIQIKLAQKRGVGLGK